LTAGSRQADSFTPISSHRNDCGLKEIAMFHRNSSDQQPSEGAAPPDAARTLRATAKAYRRWHIVILVALIGIGVVLGLSQGVQTDDAQSRSAVVIP
jgi:hypothetical protein